MAHEILERCLTEDKDVADYFGDYTEQGFDFTVDQDWEHHLQPVVDHIRHTGGTLFCETHIDYSDYVPDGFGTLDIGIIADDRIIIADLKYGQGEKVDATGNKQLMIYAYGFWRDYAQYLTDTDIVEIRIYQPRAPSPDHTWVTNLAEIRELMQEARQAARLAFQPDPPFKYSEKGCLWCAYKGKCAEYTHAMLQVIKSDFDTLEDEVALGYHAPLPDKRSLTREERSHIIAKGKLIEKWLSALYEDALKEAMRGIEQPGLKLSRGKRGRRKWVDPDIIAEWLENDIGDNAFNRVLASPAQAEKRLAKGDWDFYAPLVTQADGKLALIPDTDPRDTVDHKEVIETMFDIEGEL